MPPTTATADNSPALFRYGRRSARISAFSVFWCRRPSDRWMGFPQSERIDSLYTVGREGHGARPPETRENGAAPRSGCQQPNLECGGNCRGNRSGRRHRFWIPHSAFRIPKSMVPHSAFRNRWFRNPQSAFESSAIITAQTSSGLDTLNPIRLKDDTTEGIPQKPSRQKKRFLMIRVG